MSRSNNFQNLRELKQKMIAANKNPNKFGEEGVDHINISIISKSYIGKVFSIEYSRSFYYPYIGKFSSINSLWTWLHDYNHNDVIRRMNNKKISEYKKTTPLNKSYIPNFQAIIMYANWLKISQIQKAIDEIKAFDNKPILYYYTIKNSNLRVEIKFANWYIETVKEIIAAVKEDREPNFNLFATDPDFNDFMYTEAVLRSIFERPGHEDELEETLRKIKEREAEELAKSKSHVIEEENSEQEHKTEKQKATNQQDGQEETLVVNV